MSDMNINIRFKIEKSQTDINKGFVMYIDFVSQYMVCRWLNR